VIAAVLADRVRRFLPARPARRSTTRSALRLVQGGLLGGASIVFAVSALALQGVRGTEDTVHDRTVPAVLEVAGARAALVAADQAAIESFSGPQGQLTGPGADFQNQMAVASQSLAQLALDNVASGAAPQLQLVEGLLVSYTGLIEEADADYQIDPTPQGQRVGSAAVVMWNAAVLLHGQILPELDLLQRMEETALGDEVSSWWIGPAFVPLPAALLALLVAAQVFLAGRFRRRLNPPLMGATALLLLALAGLASVVVSHSQLDVARHTLSVVAGDWRTQVIGGETTTAVDAHSMEALLQPCAQPAGACGDGIAAFLANTKGRKSATGSVPGSKDGIASVDGAVAAADPGGVRVAGVPPLTVAVPALMAMVVALILRGLRPLVDQYRYRPA
jgi:hypothetical protein